LIKPDRDLHSKAEINSNLSKITVRSEAVGFEGRGGFTSSIWTFYFKILYKFSLEQLKIPKNMRKYFLSLPVIFCSFAFLPVWYSNYSIIYYLEKIFLKSFL
jgi:hypothetical protein